MTNMIAFTKKIILLLCLVVTLLSGTGSPALAVLRQHHSATGLRYHVHHSLPDREGRAWQVLVFPDNSDPRRYSLRLVGFPGLANFVHPAPLEIMTSTGILLASDRLVHSAPAPNVGQYDISNILTQLSSPESLQLLVPLQQKQLVLEIPPPILIEWQWLLEQSRTPGKRSASRHNVTKY
ncbi:MAG: DUF3122 domain-containing protein [Cyanophyceae cyanobacterium]